MRNWSRLLLMGLMFLGPFKIFITSDFARRLRTMSTGRLRRIVIERPPTRFLFYMAHTVPGYSQGSVGHFSSLPDNAMSNEKDVEMRKMFEEWMAKYGRTYSNPKEKETRFTVFKETVRRVNAHNKVEGRMYDKGVNQFADLTYKEFKDTYCGFGYKCG